ncbi:hypothetical protein [Bradyrhizobium sp.]
MASSAARLAGWTSGGLLLATALTFLISVTAGFVPRERLEALIRTAIENHVFEHRQGVYEETFSECVLLQMNLLRDPDPLRSALSSRWVRPGPESLHPCTMLAVEFGIDKRDVKLAEPTLYPNYHFGGRYLAAIGLSVMGVANLRFAYELLSYASLLLLLAAAWRNSRERFWHFLPIGLVLLFGFGQYGYAHNIAAAPQFDSIFLVLAAIVGFREWFAPLHRRLFAMSFLGAWTIYFDTIFSFSFVLSLVLVTNHLFYVPRGDLRAAIRQGAAVLAVLAGSMAVTFALHVMLMDYMYGIPPAYFIGGIAARTASSDVGTPLTHLDVIKQLYSFLGQLTGSHGSALALVLASAMGWVIALVAVQTDPNQRVPGVDLAVLAVGAGGIFLWYALFVNHTYVHAFMMVRLLALPISYGFVAALITVQSARSALRPNR